MNAIGKLSRLMMQAGWNPQDLDASALAAKSLHETRLHDDIWIWSRLSRHEQRELTRGYRQIDGKIQRYRFDGKRIRREVISA